MSETMTAAYDRAYDAITADDELALARKKLSLHELRTMVGHCAVAFAGTAWRSMDTLPDDGGPSRNQDWPGLTVLAITADGLVMQMRPWMVRNTAKAGTPRHLQFPAIGWMPVPPLSSSPTENADEA